MTYVMEVRIELIRVGQLQAVDLEHLDLLTHHRPDLVVFGDVLENAMDRGRLAGARHTGDEHAAGLDEMAG